MRSEFARLTKNDPRVGKALTAFLAQAYKYKEIGDYGIGADALVAMPDAEAAITSATDFIEEVAELLG